MEREKIKKLLEERFSIETKYPKKRRIIFWYDAGGAFKNQIEEIEIPNVKILYLTKGLNRKDEEIYTNIFKIKYTLEVEDTNSNYLIYSEYKRPDDDRENFLLDIEKYSEYFRANKCAMIIEEFKFDRTNEKLANIIEKYEQFFASKERKEKISKLLENETYIDEEILKLGILSTLAGAKALNFSEVLKEIIIDNEKLVQVEKWMGLDYFYEKVAQNFQLEVKDMNQLLKIFLVVTFYREINERPHINLENYYTGNKSEIYLFVDNLLQNKLTSEIITKKFHSIGEDLGIQERIEKLELDKIVKGTIFEYFDKLIIKEIEDKLNKGLKEYDLYKKYIDVRLDNTLWKEKYKDAYVTLLAAINLYRLKEEFYVKERDTLHEIFEDYKKEYFSIDRYYREFYYSYDNVKDIKIRGILDKLDIKIKDFYENEYLENLLGEWSNHIQERDKLPSQRDFYRFNLKNTDTRVAVIISDALRYEVATEIQEKLFKNTTSKDITLEGMLTSLPSITSLGMGNLLPHEKIEYLVDDRKVLVDNINSSSTENREQILKKHTVNSSAISYANFKNMHREDQLEYIKGKKIIYIYHDTIDATGDKGKTESQTFEACDTAVKQITDITRILAGIGVISVMITSDHGFIYERGDIKEYDKLEFNTKEYKILGKRYGISDKFLEEKGCTTLKLFNDNYGVFPNKNQRIKASGNGLQFVHGGISPQEMIVPLLKYRSGANATKAKKVAIRLKEAYGKITSNITKFGIYQLDGVSKQDKIFERSVKIALYDNNGSKVSDEAKITLNSIEENKLYSFRLILSGDHKEVILKAIDIDTGDILDSKKYHVNLGIATDFDF